MFETLEYNNPRLVYTVTQISNEIKFILEDSYQAVWVQGEISNFKLYNSGHMYFNIKDTNAQIKAVMFQNVNIGLVFVPEDGMKVLVYGKVSSYPKYGDYQIIVNHMEQYGRGELYESYERLKKQLKDEGLFDDVSKKPIPNLVNKIGVVTSQDGAAIYDILKVIDNLNVNVEVLIYPVRVQGKDAEKEITQAIQYLNEHHKNLDVLLVGRGGGSVEDLSAFNTESVARAIFASKIPIVSCVGHELDFTITDFVADMRASTPSTAAEIVLRNRNNMKERVEFLKKSIIDAVNFMLGVYSEKFDRFASSRALTSPHLIYEDKTSYIKKLNSSLLKNIDKIFESKFKNLKNISHELNIVSPLSVLKRGFSICFDRDNKIVKDSKNIDIGDDVNVKLFSGNFTAKIVVKQ
ncbi:MAG: exodeoxyribonuclease VII large subunit [Endomicrobium sp.]|nr:exodeoxyribonuclease VII large subunit [Endomicrobium sp.]